MPYDAPSAVERSPPHPTEPPTMVCPSCGDTMKHVRTIAKLGVRSEQLIFVCPSCNAVDSKKLKLVA
jgi:predicted RNA-binding Zn-ribbon protein involved in translation (DUF1610 family)